MEEDSLAIDSGVRMDWAARGAWIAVVALWVSKRADPFLVVLFITLIASLLALPFRRQLLRALAPLPGVRQRLDASSLLGPALFGMGVHHEDAVDAIGATMVVLPALAVGRAGSRKSPVLGLVIYIICFICAAQSGFFDDYPVRLVAPVLLLGLSAYSRHIRYLNLSATVFATVALATEEDEPGELKDLVPLCLWGGFALLLLQDILVRIGFVESMIVATESVVLAFVILVVVEHGGSQTYEIDFGKVGEWLQMGLQWPEIFPLECLPSCMNRFKASIPGIFCSLFGLVTICRNVVASRAKSNIATLISAIGVIGSFISACVVFKKLHWFLEPNFTSVVSVMALFVSARIGGIKLNPLGKKGKRIGYHKMIYWHGGRKMEDPNAEGCDEDDSDGSADGEDEEGDNEKNVEMEARKRIRFSDDGNEQNPTEKHVEAQWEVFEVLDRQLQQAKRIHKRYKDAAFAQEAYANGMKGFDEDSKVQAAKARERADETSRKCREASLQVKSSHKKANEAREKAEKMERRLLEIQKEMEG